MENKSDLKDLKTVELVELYASILKELNNRKVVRTFNSPVGDYAEWLFAKVYNLSLESNSNKGYDVIDNKNNIRYQIKSRWFNSVRESRQLNVIRNYEDDQFDYIIAIFFNEKFKVKEVYKIPHKVVGDYGRHSEHQNGYILTVNQRVIMDERVENITTAFHK
ncbi:MULTISPECIES: DUF6998 domain-containing protein [Clostridium]|uniref:DUF6998 domain-containing protein n=1 Tax=Clostridium TaxID=1485 RepID=UPI0002CADB45|nr:MULTISPECIES: hypothetical protein [Clostridium]EMU55648.1 hypothetical protein CBDKU1_03760 [Clostridium butyricum DKU-01]